MSVEAICPPLNAKHGMGIPRQGQWTDMGPDLAKQVYQGLAVGTDDSQRDEVVSIPDVWAQVVMASGALLDDRHPRHAEVESQWRGLLALLALADHHDLDLELIMIDISAGSGPASATRFASLIREVVPQNVLLDGQSWLQLGAILFRGRPVGLMVPDILVCPARERGDFNDLKVRWTSDGCLSDPCQCKQMLKEDYLLLSRYVANLEAALDGFMRSGDRVRDEAMCGAVVRELRDFRRDLGRIIQGQGQKDDIQERYDMAALPGEALGEPVYDLLRQVPRRRHAEGVETSELLLPFRPGIGAAGGALLLAEGLERQWSRSPRDVMLWRHDTLEHYNRMEPEQRVEWVEQVMEEGYQVLRPEDLLADHLVEISGANFAAHPKGLTSCLLPLKPLALMFLGPEQLGKNLTLDRNDKLTLSLELGDPGATTRTYRIERSYQGRKLSRQAGLSEDLPLQLIWPDVDAGLPHFYHYHFTQLEEGLTTLSPFLPEMAQAYLKEHDDRPAAEALVDLARALSKADGWESENAPLRKHYRDNKSWRAGLTWSVRPPEALVCQYHDEKGDPIEQGLLLLPPLKRQDRYSGNYRVALDLGSDNTTVYFSYNDDEPKPLSLGGRLHSPLHKGVASQVLPSQIQRDFLGPEAMAPPLPSILLTRGGSLFGLLALVQARPWLYQQRNYPITNLLHELRDGYKVWPNLKWESDPDKREGLGTFVETTALLALNEVACMGGAPSEISWHFAYPEAIDNLEHYKERQETAVRRVLEPLLSEDEMRRVDFQFTPEAVAAARHLVSRDVNFQGAVITMDVGGSTTDIAIWQRKCLVWQGSFKIGGHDVLNLLIANRLDVLEGIDNKMGRKLEDMRRDMRPCDPRDKTGYARLLNAVTLMINAPEFDGLMKEAWPVFSNQNMDISLYISLFQAGLFYYLGSVVDALTKRGAFDPGMNRVHLCLGGRGSLMFDNFLDRETRGSRARRFFAEATSMTENLDLVLERNMAKHEVARGMLLQGQNLDEDNGSHQVVLGERISVVPLRGEATELLATDYWKREHLEHEPKLNGLGALRRFLEAFNRHYSYNLGLTPEQEERLIIDIEAELMDNRDRINDLGHQLDEALRSMPPVFILALRHYLKRSIESHWG